MYLISGVSGNTGSAVAEQLLASGEKLRVYVRDATKGESWEARGAEVAVGSLDDAAALQQALVGVNGAYLLIPPDLAATDALGRGATIVAAFKAALEAQPVPHVVYLSSIAAQVPQGTGPILTHHRGEQVMRSQKSPVTFVRPGYFMENLLAFTVPLTTAGVLPALFDADQRMAMVATADIGRVAAEALLGPTPNQNQVIELSGPTEYSLRDAAEQFTKVLGREVNLVAIPADAVASTLQQAGVGADMARLYADMMGSIASGTFGFEGGSARAVRGTITLESFIQAAFAQAESNR
ncbi:MAG: NmrA family NAD(P)-binding protein [Candidatus Eisenbacteria bacterium]